MWTNLGIIVLILLLLSINVVAHTDRTYNWVIAIDFVVGLPTMLFSMYYNSPFVLLGVVTTMYGSMLLISDNNYMTLDSWLKSKINKNT